jgi:hypothetical protein
MNNLRGPATILGGLPVWAECWFTRGDGWTTDDDCGVDALYWLRRDGTKGAPLPQKIIDRLDKTGHWEASVCEAVCDYFHERGMLDERDAFDGLWRELEIYFEELAVT